MAGIAYIELAVVGGHKAYIEAGAIVGLITAPGRDANDIATPDNPVTLILRGGETFKIIGESVAKVLVRAIQVRRRLSVQNGAGEFPDILVDWLDTPNAAGPDDERAAEV